MLGDDAKASPLTSELSAADQLFRSGKFVEAEVGYRAILEKDAKLVPAQVGLVRAMLRQQKIDESFEIVNKAIVLQPNSAGLLAVKGEVQFRRGEMSEAEDSYLKSKKIDPKEPHAYLGLAHLYASYSLYRKAYDQLQAAHNIAPDDVEVQKAWLGTLPRKERITALEAYLGGLHPDDDEETQSMQEYLDFLKATANQPVHACKLLRKVEKTDVKLGMVMADANHMSGIGLQVQLNHEKTYLQFDTGAGGIMVSRKVAERTGLTPVSAVHYSGIGDKGLQHGFRAIADHIRIGALDFQDCVVRVSDKRSLLDRDGFIGADVLSAYVVDIDLPGMMLKLSPLPKRPEDEVVSMSLNSTGEEQVNVEQKEESTNQQDSKDQKSSAPETKIAQPLPKDRYIAPEMATWTKVFRFGHLVLVPTFVNDSPPMLFGLDTGAFDNILSLRGARGVGKVNSDYWLRVRGLNGESSDVYSAKAALHFGHLQQPNMNIVTLDLSSQSRRIGTELSGFLGFGMLRVLEVKIDYRDGLVDFEYDPNRIPSFSTIH